MRKATRLLTIAAQALAVAAALTALTILVVPRAFGWRLVDVLSGSMTPTYPARSVLALEAVNPSRVRAGDVIAFHRGDDPRTLVTHRVVRVQHSGGQLSFVTKGDANSDADRDPVPASELRGRVVFGAPHLGWLVQTVHTPAGYAGLLLFPGMLVIANEIGSIRRELRGGASAGEAGADGTTRQVLLATIAADWTQLLSIADLTTRAGGSIEVVGPASITVALVAEPARVRAFEEALQRYGVVASAKSRAVTVPAPAGLGDDVDGSTAARLDLGMKTMAVALRTNHGSAAGEEE
ncbi:MAG TPA: signal peptidase I [Acidimicrobiales bacterium]|nr:signal peptidase I [Acidimicrobiales bacterium]